MTTRTFSSLNENDYFACQPGGVPCCKVTYADGRTFYRSVGGGMNVDATGQDFEVHDVTTEAERTARYEAQRAREVEAARARCVDFRTLIVDKVRLALGKEWKAVDDERTSESMMHGECRVELRTGSGATEERIVFAMGRYNSKGRIDSYGLLRNDSGMWYVSTSSITMAPDKAPEAIARDVTRRLLPTYREALAKAREKEQAANDYAALCAATKRTLDLDFHNGGDSAWHEGISVRVSGASVRLEFTTNAKTAARIIAIIEKANAET